MVVRENSLVKVSIDKSNEFLLIRDGYILEALDLAESLNCECYAVNSDKLICASVLIYGKRCRVFAIREYKNKGPEISFYDKFLNKELVNKHSDVVKFSKSASRNLVFKLEDLPLGILVEFCDCVIKTRRASETENKLKRRKR